MRPHATRAAFAWLRFLLSLALLALLVRSLVVAPFNIPSRSMTPRMIVGDYLFVAKWPYGYSRYSFPFAPGFIEGRIWGSPPQRGDIVVFQSPAGDDDYVKRLIGLPGDRVQMIDGVVVLNGAPVPRVRIADFVEPAVDGTCETAPWANVRLERGPAGEMRCRTARYREILPGGASYEVLDIGDSVGDNTIEFAVPTGHYFMLGDDRDRSADSRFVASAGGGVGMIPAENLIGRALVVFWSTDGGARWINPASWFSATRWERIGETF
ncbi:MAG: signal peptidase I [Sphingomonadaceae bacterium]|nr:signal peptidase I [Sphingomonadaceae bacterium]